MIWKFIRIFVVRFKINFADIQLVKSLFKVDETSIFINYSIQRFFYKSIIKKIAKFRFNLTDI